MRHVQLVDSGRRSQGIGVFWGGTRHEVKKIGQMLFDELHVQCLLLRLGLSRTPALTQA